MRTRGTTRRRALVIGGVTAAVVAVVGVGVAVAVNAGTAGELNYQKKTFTITGTNSGTSNFFNKKVSCPAERHVTGGGFEGDRSNSVGAFDGRPYDSGDAGNVPDDGWMVEASVYSTNTGDLTVYAICDD